MLYLTDFHININLLLCMNIYILESMNLLDASVNVEVSMTEEFPAFQKDELSPEENILIKTETNSHDEVEERDTEVYW